MIWTLPNCLTFSRILAAPLIAMMVVIGGPETANWAFGLFVVASLTDFLDGWLARKLDQISAIGKMLDPIADKAMVVLILAALMGQSGAASIAFALPVMLILLREVLVSGLREFLGNVKLPVTQLAKWKTTAQLIAIGALLLVPLVTSADTISSQETANDGAANIFHAAGIGLLWIAAVLTMLSGWDYFRKGIAHIRAAEE